ncbi:MAG: hypothetical protein SFV15_04740 [Polyangiaceae bacterium]|nr:hypothetical protein [Polyangiaceae bacterium]
MSLVSISRALSKKVEALHFSAPVHSVYNPLGYARKPHEAYLETYGSSPKEVVLVGMNPGPFGMAQTGVPFGDVVLVREWLKISGKVERPAAEHPKRQILGFECKRREVSGSRLWGWAKARFVSPERFFERFFVVNYCPLAFMEEGGKNLTPDKLLREERDRLQELCDEALQKTVATLSPKLVVGVGAFAEARAKLALAEEKVKVGVILHPSPQSPAANRGWAEAIEKQLAALGVHL